jgi:tetratricopeptide (TPR) repeat protein
MRALKSLRLMTATAGLAVLALTSTVHATDVDFATELRSIAQDWDRANFESVDAAARRQALEALSNRAARFTQRFPNRAEPLVWEGIVLSSYAGAKGGLGALGLAKRSRERLLSALKIEPAALNGSAYTSLGVLYYKVPGFPVGFGNHDKAREFLNEALQINPDGIDPNFFYGELLFEEGDYARALQYLQKAQNAAPRPDRPVADHGRQREIAALIQRTRAKLS